MDIKRYALRLKMHKKAGDAVHSCAMVLRDILKKKGTIVQGYAITEYGEKLQYYWVESEDGEIYDICFEIAKLKEPSIGTMKFSLLKEAPNEFDKDDHNQELFKQYQDEASKFWKSVPRLS